MNKYDNLNPEEYLEFLEAERDFLNHRIDLQKDRVARAKQYEKSIEDDTDSATEFGMDYQKEMQNQ